MNIDSRNGGALSRSCPWYVERQEDQRVLNHLLGGRSCYVLTSHQMGKSSLVVRLVEKLGQARVRSAVVDLAAFGRELTAAQWYHALAHRIGRQLNLEDAFDLAWSESKDLSPFRRFVRTLDQALKLVPEPLVFFVDEIDLLGSLPFSPDEFLEAVQATTLPGPGAPLPHGRISFCLLGTVLPEQLWRTRGRADSSLGQVFLLRDFARDDLGQVTHAVAHRLRGDPAISWPDQLYAPDFLLERVFDRVFYWTSGHPYLTQILSCSSTSSIVDDLHLGVDILVEQCHDRVDQCCETLFIHPAAWPEDAHLLWISHRLLRSDLNAAQIFDSHPSDTPSRVTWAGGEDDSRWRTSGIVRVRDRQIEWRNRVYERVFGGTGLRRPNRWQSNFLPGAPPVAVALGEERKGPLSFLGTTLQAVLCA